MFTLDQYIQFFLIGASIGTALALGLGKRPQPKGIQIRRASVKDMPAELRAAFEAPIDGAAILQDLADKGIISITKKEETVQ